MHKLKKVILILAGSISLTLGIVGIVVPLLPTTPFLLLAAACYVRASKPLYNWLMNNKVLGEYIRNYLHHKAIPLKSKAIALCLLWVGIGYSALIVVELIWVRVLLTMIALGVTLYILRLNTLQESAE